MKKICIFALTLAMVAVSCQREMLSVESIESREAVIISKYEVSQEEALQDLNSELDFLYGESTRSNGILVADVKSVKLDDIVSSTRSVDIEVDDVLYIVEFADGKGSAILGADRRVEDVFAVLEEGVISIEDFQNAADGVETDKLTTYLAGLIADEAMDQLLGDTTTLPFPGQGDELRYGYFEYTTIVEEDEECFLRTKWGQGYPFNNLCYNEDGALCPAGCVTISAAQTILYSYPSYPIPYGIILVDPENEEATTSFDRRLLNLKCDDIILSPAQQLSVDAEVASYVYKLAQLLKIRLQPGGSGGNTSKIVDILTATGLYNEVDYVEVVNDDFMGVVRDQLYIRKLPAPFRGGQVNSSSGHSWVLDAFKYLKQNEYLCTMEGNTLVDREFWGVKETKKVHCNFGWNGMCDGYYTFGMFDVSQVLDDEDIVGEIGDEPSSQMFNPFNVAPGIVVYEL